MFDHPRCIPHVLLLQRYPHVGYGSCCSFPNIRLQFAGIVSLLFCGICLKHYAYHNMSRRTQLSTKFVFQVTSQLSENFIFIYLGLSLFTDKQLDFKPLFILITVAGICAARWAAVFPLSRAINAISRYRQRRRGVDTAEEEIPYAHQAMIYWAGLRGAVGVALAAGLTGNNGDTLRATVLVVVVLTVIIFGGTTARMLEILGIRTGVVEEIDSDDEFDIEVVSGGTFQRNKGTGIGHTPQPSQNGFGLSNVNGAYSSGSINRNSPPTRPNGQPMRRNSSKQRFDGADQGLLSPGDSNSADEDDGDLDLPPAARRSPNRQASPLTVPNDPLYPTSGHRMAETGAGEGSSRVATATDAVKQLFSELSQDPANAFRHIDDGFLKPHLLLDPGQGKPGPGNV